MICEHVPDKNASIKTTTSTILLCANAKAFVYLRLCVKKKWHNSGEWCCEHTIVQWIFFICVCVHKFLPNAQQTHTHPSIKYKNKHFSVYGCLAIKIYNTQYIYILGSNVPLNMRAHKHLSDEHVQFGKHLYTLCTSCATVQCTHCTVKICKRKIQLFIKMDDGRQWWCESID